jgi:DNA polymerase zeta
MSLANESSLTELDSAYYITKNIIPPLERIFNLVGANVARWYDEMPKFQRIRPVESIQRQADGSKDFTMKKTLESYMKSSLCVVCRNKLESDIAICSTCLDNAPQSILKLRTKLAKAEKLMRDLESICRSCAGLSWCQEVRCDSKDCPVFYTRTKQKARLRMERAVSGPILALMENSGANEVEW